MTAARPIDRELVEEKVVTLVSELTEGHWSEGRAWYPEARAEAERMAEATGYTVEQCIAVIAHLSPRTRWDKNVATAWKVVTFGDAPAIPRSVAGAKAALGSDDPLATLTGPKTRSFAANLAGDEEAVTLDSWMRKACGLGERELYRSGVYEQVADLFRDIAGKIGATPRDLQAAVWCYMRGRSD